MILSFFSMSYGNPGSRKSIDHLLIAIALFTTTSCAPKFGSNGTTTLVTACVLPSDQTGTLAGRWAGTPIPIAIQAGAFSSSEVSAIVQAANTWNQFYAQSLGLSMIDYGSASSPRTSQNPKPASLCSQTVVQGSSYVAPIVIYKDFAWPYTSTTIALTNFCTNTSSPLNTFYMAAMEMNYQNYFVSGTQQPDLQTIVLHELGHVAGLGHSCDGTGAAGVPNCANPSLPQDYVSAVMFPSFTFDDLGNGEQKRALTSNDEGRANCLYKTDALR